jgi:hypothetical protein
VTSAARWRANRRNARKCTGPRTAQGKARAARNARRHGLTQSARFDPKLARVVATLAQAIAGEGAGARRRACAGEVALAQVEVMRVRQARHDLFARALEGGHVIKRMANLERYERRALSRRKRAIRDFDAALKAAGQDMSQLSDKTKPKTLDESMTGAPQAAAGALTAGASTTPAPTTRVPTARVPTARAFMASRSPGRSFLTKRNQKPSMEQCRARRRPPWPRSWPRSWPRWPARGRAARPPPHQRQQERRRPQV